MSEGTRRFIVIIIGVVVFLGAFSVVSTEPLGIIGMILGILIILEG
jgi:hypothetical protein